jgi:hypothetical protein
MPIDWNSSCDVRAWTENRLNTKLSPNANHTDWIPLGLMKTNESVITWHHL